MLLKWFYTFAVMCVVAFPAFAMPMCRVLTGVDGAPAILINNQPTAPLFFCVNNQFNRDEVLLEELKLAADAGIPLFALNVSLDWDGDSNPNETIDRFRAAHPDGYFYIRVWMGASGKWLAEHPEAAICKADGTPTPWVSPASDVWRKDAARLLKECLQEIVEGPHGDKFIGVMVSALSGGEWFFPDTNDYVDYSEVNAQRYRAWLRKRFLNEKAFSRAWNDPNISLDTIAVPTPEMRDAAALGPFRDPIAHRNPIEYQRYHHEMIADAIAEFAKVAKRATHERALVGAFYGYTMELNGVGPRALANSGHLAFAKLLDLPEIDLIHAPYSYLNRELGNPAHFHLPLDSVPLHGKLVILEEDSRTHLAAHVPEEHLAAGNVAISTTLDEMLSINRRNIASALTHRAGMWYFDVLADGRWNDEKFWESAGLTRRMFAQARGSGRFDPHIAFVVSEESVHTLRATTEPYLMQSLSLWRTELDNLGAPVGYYLQSDLARLPDSVCVIILANAFSISENEKRAIDRFLKRGGTIVWNFAPNCMGPSGFDLSRVQSITGLQIDREESMGTLRLKSKVTEETWELHESWELRFKVTTTDNVHAIAEYGDTGSVATAATPLNGGISVYTAVPRLPVGILRWIGANSGVHFYRDTPGMVGVFGPYFVAHTSAETAHTFQLPEKVRSIERLVPYSRIPVATDTDKWQDSLPANSTAIYRLNN